MSATHDAVRDPTLMDALDLPEGLHSVQNAYWRARGEWNQLDLAYRRVITNMLKQLAAPPEGEEENRG